MKFSEEKNLKKVYGKLKRYCAEHETAAAFFQDIESVKIRSLQDLTFQSDLSFFAEVHSILSIIISIISRPHLSNKGEDVILRADQVQGIHAEMLRKTLQDARLWKQKGQEMIPREVYYYQNTDNLRIYENIFIVKLIDRLENELNKYQIFYLSQIKNIEEETSNIFSNQKVEDAFLQLDQLMKKIRKIKGTYFYKDVSEVKRQEFMLHPTNILLKDSLYNHCYRFYKKLLSYGNETEWKKNLQLYYFFLLVQYLKKNQYRLSLRNKNSAIYVDHQIEFTLIHPQFRMKILSDFQDSRIELTIQHKKIDKVFGRHLLLVQDADSTVLLPETSLKKLQDSFDSISSISLWNIRQLTDEESTASFQPQNEMGMIETYCKDRLRCVKGSHFIYRRHCPVCKSGYLKVDDKITCLACHSSYALFEQDSLWFINIRR